MLSIAGQVSDIIVVLEFRHADHALAVFELPSVEFELGHVFDELCRIHSVLSLAFLADLLLVVRFDSDHRYEAAG